MTYVTLNLDETKIIVNIDSKSDAFLKVSPFRSKITLFSKIQDSNIIENDVIERLEKESD